MREERVREMVVERPARFGTLIFDFRRDHRRHPFGHRRLSMSTLMI